MKTIKKINNPITLIFLGLQGSGKGTQALELKKRYNFTHIETGAIFREMAEMKKGYPEAVKIMKQGKLVPSRITNKIMDKEISKINKNQSLILDGYPRSISQVYALNKVLKKTNRDKNYLAAIFKINKKKALDRLLNRWICPKCGMIFNSFKAKCKCGGKPEKRVDEKPELIKNRFKYVSAALEKIKKYYQKKGKLIEINGERSIKEITRELIEKVEL